MHKRAWFANTRLSNGRLLASCTLAAAAGLFALACSDNVPTNTSTPPAASTPAGPQFSATEPFNDQGACLASDAFESGATAGVNDDQDLAAGNCTANDIRIATVDIDEYSFDGTTFIPFNPGDEVTCNEGDPLFIRVDAHVDETATSERTDIGIWIAQDGGNARTGLCNHYNLVNGVAGVSNIDSDQCGDMNLGAESVVPLGVINAICQPASATNDSLHIGSCLGWTQPGGDQVCPTNAGGADGFRFGTVPGTTSKCNCEGFNVPIIVVKSAKLEVVKACTPSNDPGTFDLLIDGSNQFANNVACGGTTGAQTLGAGTSADPGALHTFGEGDFSLTTAAYTSSFSCVNRLATGPQHTPFTGTSLGPVDITLQPDEDVICTYTNVRKAGITIIKDAVPNDAQDFAFTTSGTGLSNFSLDDDGDAGNTLSNTKSFTNLTPGGSRTITETTVAGFTLTNIVCSGATSSTVAIGADADFDAGDNAVTIGLTAGETVSCTFTNTKNGSLTIVKDAVPNNAQDFAYTATGTGVSNFSLDDDADNTLSNTKTFSDLLAGSRTITETQPVAGWTLTNIVCSGATSSTVTIGADADFDAGDNAVTVDLATGENVSCTFTNTKQGKLTIVKDTKNPETDPQDFAYTGSGTGLSNFSLDDDADNTLSNTKEFTGLLPNGTRTVTETPINAAWALTNIVCTGATSSTVAIGADADFDAGDNAVAIGLSAGEEITCTFTNERKAKLTVDKVLVGGGSQLFDFTVNNGFSPASFSLADATTPVTSGFALSPNTYRVCELNLAVDWAATATIDGNSASLINPDFPQDLGNRCVDVPLAYGDDKTVVWTNTPPPAGGDARTIGYWKNWSSCSQSNGKQYDKAVAPGGAGIGATLDGNLPQTIGDLLVNTCPLGVSILSKQDVVTGQNRASDAAYALAAQLLAAKLNVTAGADVCAAATTAINGGQALLDAINFIGTGTYLKSPSANRTAALGFAATLDSYNNNTLCP